MVPSLGRRARMRWDEARGAHVLLYPEGVLVLTPEAAEVLEHIDGARSVADIVEALAADHPEVPRDVINTDVHELLQRLVARGFVAMDAAR